MLTYVDALKIVQETVSTLPLQTQPLSAAAGLVLAAPARAYWDMPRWDNSAMDGFAVASQALSSSDGLEIVGSSFAGHPYDNTLQPGEAIQITTGAPLPDGADTVIPIEDAIENGSSLRWAKSVQPKQHVRYRGEEYRANEVLLERGTILQAGAIGLLASAGVTEVEVYPRPHVAVFSTGDELVELGQELGPGQIVNSNLLYLCARLRECGCTVTSLGIVEDRSENLDQLIEQAKLADLLLSTGGVSVGEKDLVQQTLQQHGFERKFWKVAIKPGKPVLFGLLDGKPCFGLPGNPAATAATFELFVLPALRILAGLPAENRKIPAALLHEVKGGSKREAFLWAHYHWHDGECRVEVPQRQGSGQTRSVQGANALLSVPIGSADLSAGDKVKIIPLDFRYGEM
ncbi:molybdopterin molybdotransferase [Malonomonas rubra DSM 5091]|uniref:Molybdopterin molybdenumtransferase n=1 Tax=Malonomonas rubra DSM 5091 TaxID=1122189 RepID=A0A1M6NIQ0_MALRU|nr:gephyrin-like molybdotransferase Glp [Malonomonas rubra]SHJ95618.1 molybdopterin molybdotransferase [Malonomonas rubra DSM 5091]